jgi:hypothetical protein
MFAQEFEKKAKIIKKAGGPNLDADAANAVSNSFKGATGGGNTLNKLKGLFGMGTPSGPGQVSNVSPKG